MIIISIPIDIHSITIITISSITNILMFVSNSNMTNIFYSSAEQDLKIRPRENMVGVNMVLA